MGKGEGFVVLLISFGLLIGGISLIVINGTITYNEHIKYHHRLEKSMRYLYTAENTRNMSLMGDRVHSAYIELGDLEGNFDWCLIQFDCQITPETDITSIKESMLSVESECRKSNGTALDYQAMVLLIENIIYDMEIANNITTKIENDYGWFTFGSVLMALGGLFLLIVAIVMIKDD